MSYLPWCVGCLCKKCDKIAVFSCMCKQKECILRILMRSCSCSDWKTQWGEKEGKMNHEDGTDPWFSQWPETPPWDAAEYNQLISARPLLPLLEQYASIGTMHDQKRDSCHACDEENGILLMSHNVIFRRFLWPNPTHRDTMASLDTGR